MSSLSHLDNIKQLPVAERIQLVEDIWDTIAMEARPSLNPSSQQREQWSSRLAEHRADPSSATPWHEVRDKLFKNRP